jgi:hypothetical protein
VVERHALEQRVETVETTLQSTSFGFFGLEFPIALCDEPDRVLEAAVWWIIETPLVPASHDSMSNAPGAESLRCLAKHHSPVGKGGDLAPAGVIAEEACRSDLFDVGDEFSGVQV